MSPPVIEATGLRKQYGTHVAVDGVDLAVEHGQILGVLGPNGAGKSTSVRMLTTMTVPDAGSARIMGLDVVADARRVRQVIGVTGQDASVDEVLTNAPRRQETFFQVPRVVPGPGGGAGESEP